MTLRPLAQPPDDQLATRRPPTRVLLVDDHPAVRLGLTRLLSDEADIEIVGSADSAAEALAQAKAVPVDVAVVDYHLGDRDGLWLTRELTSLPRPVRVLVYSAYADGRLAAAAALAGAVGVTSKGSLGDEVRRAVKAVARGRRLLPPTARQVAGSLGECLDPDDQAIFGMFLHGWDADEVARALRLTPDRLESRRRAILDLLTAVPDEPIAG
jgi:DNA-binding NarL/FixJ family response regulator